MARSIDQHPADCTCPPCENRRRPEERKGRQPLVGIRAPQDVIDWLRAQPGGASKAVEDLVREKKREAADGDA